MKRFLCATLLLVAACAPAPPPPPEISAEELPSPCDDELYLALKEIPLVDLSDRQFAYLSEKDRECAEFQRSQIEAAPHHRIAETYQNFFGLTIVLVGVSLAIALVVGLSQ